MTAIIEGVVHGAGATAPVQTVPSPASRSRTGVVSRPYPFEWTWSTRSESMLMRRTLVEGWRLHPPERAHSARAAARRDRRYRAIERFTGRGRNANEPEGCRGRGGRVMSSALEAGVAVSLRPAKRPDGQCRST